MYASRTPLGGHSRQVVGEILHNSQEPGHLAWYVEELV